MATWALSFGDTFLNELLNLPQSVQKRVTKVTKILRSDPISGQGDAKKLKGYKNNVYRIRIGNYRLIYSFGEGWVQLLSIRKRDERTYGLEVPSADPIVAPPNKSVLQPQPKPTSSVTPVVEIPLPAENTPASQPQASNEITTALPFALTEAILSQWQIPSEFWPAILVANNSEALLEIPIPDQYIGRILDNLYPRPIEDIAAQHQYVLSNPDDLERYVEGALSDFLLKLDPEQEKLKDFGGQGPTLVKGGPGTGKSTLALYRVQTLLERGHTSILFTTYTNALARYSEQLLTQLLGKPPQEAGVTVSTVDALVIHHTTSNNPDIHPATTEACIQALEKALQVTQLPALNSFDRQVRLQSLTRLGNAYILEEFLSVIESWEISSLDDYLTVNRVGRGYPLQKKVRESLWALYQTWQQLMSSTRGRAWEQMRRIALNTARQLPEKPFDAIIIDEAQDLSPNSLRFLLELTPSFDGVYLTADASQSLYQRGFSWSQIHSDLQVRGRTLLLKRNYRNTEQIAAACADFLKDTTAGDLDCIQQTPSPYQGNLPKIILSDSFDEMTETIGQFFIDAAKQFRIPIHGGAVLVPHKHLGRAIAKRLFTLGIEANFIAGKNLDITQPYVKVLTLHSAKGLEFPFVAIAGLDDNQLPGLSPDIPKEEVPIALDEKRRLLYVGCSRAMRALLVCAPKSKPSRFLTQLGSPYWSREER